MDIQIPRAFSHLEINDEIARTLDVIYKEHKNCLLLGKAGTGKSVTLNLIKALDEREGINSIFLAPTGIAAVNIEGATIHATFKLGIHPKKPHHYNLHPDTLNLLRAIDRIVIDEISMVRADIFDAMDLLCRDARENDDYFGGVQLVCVGDCYQLPPIIGKSKEEKQFYTDQYGANPYFFASPTYQENAHSFEKIVYNKIYRQNDGNYKDILNRIREGVQTDKDLDTINDCMTSLTRHKVANPDSIYLAPFNNIVESVNNSELNKLKTETINFNARVNGFINPKNFIVSQNIRVKAGASIMTLINDPSGQYQNGTTGIFRRVINDETILIEIDGEEVYMSKYDFQEYKYEAVDGVLKKRLKGSFRQFPFKLAYASTFHKGQGQTFESGYVDFAGSLFDYHMAYVALSRFTDMDKLGLKRKLHHSDITVSPFVKEFMEDNSARISTTKEEGK